MTYKSDIEIAQSAKLRPITEIAKAAGIDENISKSTADTRLKLIFLILPKTPAKTADLYSSRR